MFLKRQIIVILGCCSLVACAQDQSLRVAGSGATSAALVRTGDDHRPHGGMLRYPDISATHIAFVYANDIWVVAREGGVASPLASPPGAELFPRFSADGSSIGFVGNYDGNSDLYTIATAGGVATRVTHHPAQEILCDWTSDGELVFFSSALAGLGRQEQLFTVSSSGGLPKKLPVPYGANGTISADGEWLAYTPHTRDHRTWKRYRGGMATDIWLFNLKNHSSKKITDWEGTDSQPMWHGDTVYYMSDGGAEHRLNIWSYDVSSGRRRQLTKHQDFDVKWPAAGPGASGEGEVVYQLGSELMVLNLRSGESSAVDVRIPGDRPTIRTKTIDAGEFIKGGDISSTGKRVVVEARGDIWTLPAKNGSPRNLTRTSGVAERDPSWSPDGRWVAYFSDESGEYELCIAPSAGKGETQRATTGGAAFRYAPTWSPDSKQIAFTDHAGRLSLHTIDTKETKHFDTDDWAGQPRLAWSHDSKWITYAKTGDTRLASIWLYHVPEDKKHQVTSGRFNDTWPVFDREGKYLFFAGNRDFSTPDYEDVGTTFIYANTDVLLALPLRDEVGSPWAAKSDDEKWDEEDKKDDDESDGEDDKDDNADAKDDDKDDAKDDDKDDKDGDKKEKDKKDEKPLVIELEDMERRAIVIPVDKGNFSHLSVNHEGKLIYLRHTGGQMNRKSGIKLFDLSDEEKKEKSIVEEVNGFTISADGKKLAVRKEKTLAIVDAAPDQKLEKPISTSGLLVSIDPREEWRQIFLEAWRIKRDFFYDPNMHGVDWNEVRAAYAKMIEDCMSRADVRYVIGEMISEINVGHAYVRGGSDGEKEPEVSVGMLGADFELHDGAYRIAKIVQGAAWDADARSPLNGPGIDVNVGDYLLAVNGVAVDVEKDPWAALQGLADKSVTITVSTKPSIDDDARDVNVKLIGSESNLRYRDWIEANRAYVDQETDGRVGYIHVPNTGIDGQNNLVRQFYGQIDKSALIIDERWNSGGQIPTRFVELLNRPATNYWAVRNGNDWPWPPDSHQGPKCMLINGLAGSGGDCFPYYFKQAGVGKLIGMRTWGGLVGISGNPQLIDGGQTFAPTFAFYEMDGTWGVEGHGVDPDIEVIDDPALMVNGGDPQLDAAIEHMLDELMRRPFLAPKRPDYADRSGMGIVEADK